MTIDTNELKARTKDLGDRFRVYSLKAETGLEKAILKCGLKIEADAKRNFKGRDEESVKGEPPRVQTGLLRASITHRTDKDMAGYFVEVGTNVDYAQRQEQGSSQNWPHPFLAPAVSANKDFISDTIREAMEKAVEGIA